MIGRHAIGITHQAVDESKETRPFTLELQDDSVKIGLLATKAIAIANLIAGVLARSKIEQNDQSECAGCNSKFMMLFRKKYICGICDQSFCKNCIKHQLLIDCERLTNDVIEKVSKIVDHTHQFTKKNAIVYPVCAECFNEICLEFSQLDKANKHKRIRKQESMHVGDSRPATFTPALRDSQKTFGGQMNLRKIHRNFTGSFTGGSIHNDYLSQSKNNQFFNLIRSHNLQQVPAMEEIAEDLEQLQLSETMIIGVVENFILKLLNLDFNETLPFNLALEQLVKIFSVSNPVNKFNEDLGNDAFDNGEVRSHNGTIVQKVLRFKNYLEEASVNNILLLSLPITSPYRILDRDILAKNEQVDYRDFHDAAREPMLLPQAEVNMDDLNHFKLSARDSATTFMTNTPTILMNAKMQEKSKIRFPEDMYISLEHLSFVKQQFTNYIKDHIYKNQIELIFSTETIPSNLFEELKNHGVVVIFPVSHGEMKLLSLVLNAKIINDVSLLTQDLGYEYLGNIKNYYLVNMLDAEANYQTSLIFLDKLEPVLNEVYSALGIVIYSHNYQQNLALKLFLRDHLVYTYFSLTEHEFVVREKESIAKKISPEIEIDWSTVGDFRYHLVSTIKDLKQMLRSTASSVRFEFTEVEIESMDDDNVYPDVDNEFKSIVERLYSRLTLLEGIKNVHDIRKRIEQSILNPTEFDNFKYLFNTDLDFLASLNTTKNDSVMVINDTPKCFCYSPYSEHDLTLGKYLRLKMAEFEEKIKQDEEAWNNKQSLFYISQSCVKVRVEKATKEMNRNNFVKYFQSLHREEQYQRGLFNYYVFANETRNSKNGFLRASNISKSSFKKGSTHTNPRKELKRAASTKKLSFATGVGSPTTPAHQMGVSFTGLNVQPVPAHSSGSTAGMKSYIICDLCAKQLTEAMYMDSIHKNMSFTMFLFCIATNRKRLANDLLSIREGDTIDDIKQEAGEYCSHKLQARVFQSGKTLIKFTRYDAQVNNLLHFKQRDSLLGTNPVFSAMKRVYLNDKLQYENKVAHEISEYYIKQVSFLTYILRDLILKANRILARSSSRQTRLQHRFDQHLQLVKHYRIFSEIVRKFGFALNNFNKADLKLHYNYTLKAVNGTMKQYTDAIENLYKELFGDIRADRRHYFYADIVVRLCRIDKEFSHSDTLTSISAASSGGATSATLKPKERERERESRVIRQHTSLKRANTQIMGDMASEDNTNTNTVERSETSMTSNSKDYKRQMTMSRNNQTFAWLNINKMEGEGSTLEEAHHIQYWKKLEQVTSGGVVGNV